VSCARFDKIRPPVIFVIATDKDHFFATELRDPLSTFSFGEIKVTIVACVEHVAHKRNDLRLVPLHRSLESIIKDCGLVQIGGG
jgi:hypothetical protein